MHFNVQKKKMDVEKNFQTKLHLASIFDLNCISSGSKIMNNEIWTKFSWNCGTYTHAHTLIWLVSEGRDTNKQLSSNATQCGAFIININVAYQLQHIHTHIRKHISNVVFPFSFWNFVFLCDWTVISTEFNWLPKNK